MRAKLEFAKWLYRWSSAQAILGAVLSTATFAGVFTLLLGPVLGPFGFSYSATLLLLMGFVAAVFLSVGFTLDRVVKFWTAQAAVGTVRNPWLYDRLYQKEMLSLKERDIPEMLALRALLAETGKYPQLVAMMDEKIERIRRAVRERQWTVGPGEDIYEDAR